LDEEKRQVHIVNRPTPGEIALVKALRNLPNQEITIKMKNSAIASVVRVSSIIKKEGGVFLRMEKKEKLFPVSR
jgi:hypothetical protein